MEEIQTIYIIGIGGISLSALARILQEKNIEVLGSDLTENEMIEALIKDGFEIKIGSAHEFVKRADAVIYTSAVSNDNSDIALAKKLGKRVLSRAELLGKISEEYKTISISGTHGKTTTTGMISNIFLIAGKDPSIHIGGILNNINSNYRVGKGDYFITEACEYKDSFLSLKSHIGVILNIKEDHLDYFRNIDNIFSSFQKFAQNISKNGILVYNFDDFLAKKIKFNGKSVSFGLNELSDICAKNIKEYQKGRYSFDVFYMGKEIGKINLPVYGFHNIYNALASIAVGLCQGIDFESIKTGIEEFKGIKRRFEFISNENGNLIIHDYAHHPDEITATLKTCRELGYQKVILIFQPHTYSRTRDLYNEFLSCFQKADETWLLPIYPAREKPIKNITSKKICEDMRRSHFKSFYFSSFENCKKRILDKRRKDTLFAILGAGDIEKLAYDLKKTKKAN